MLCGLPMSQVTVQCTRSSACWSSTGHQWTFRPISSPRPAKHHASTQKLTAAQHLLAPRILCMCHGVSEGTSAAVAATLRVDIPTADARSCIRFQLVPSGTGQAIAVADVAEGSQAEQAGIQRGMKLVGISDPIRQNEMWELQDRPSLRYVRDVLRMRASPYIELCFDTVNDMTELVDTTEGAVQLANTTNEATSNSTSGTPESSIEMDLAAVTTPNGQEGQTIADKLQQQFDSSEQTGQVVTAVQQRQQRRKEYMEQANSRNDTGFLLVMAGAFILPAAIILLVAYSTGYLDNLYSNSVANMR